MQLHIPTIDWSERHSTFFRIVVVALAGFAMALGATAVDPILLALGLGYLTAAALVSLLKPRLLWEPLEYVILFLDVTVVTAILVLLAASPLPLWTLYLFPMTSGSMTGERHGAVAICLSILEYLVAAWLIRGEISLFELWPVAALLASALGVIILIARSLAERREKQVWREITAAARSLGRGDEIDQVAAVIAERARRLVRGEIAWVAWFDTDGNLHPGPLVGRETDQPLKLDPPPAALLRKLAHGTAPLSEFGEQFAESIGEVVALRRGELSVGLLAVTWSSPPRERAELRNRLRIFAGWGGDALIRAQARAAMVDQLRWEGVLRRAAADLLATLDSQEVRRIIVSAAGPALDATVSLVDRPSGKVVAGETELAGALMRLALSGESPEGNLSAESTAVPQPDASLVSAIDGKLVLIAWRKDRPFERSVTARLSELVALMRAALERCAAHEQLQTKESQLRGSFEAMPAPFIIRAATGKVILANAAYRDLASTDLPPGVMPQLGATEREVIVGEPPRVFIASTTAVGDGENAVTFFREITREREALRAQDDLMAMVGHELRTPLTSIYGYSQMMSRQLGIVEEQVGQLNSIIGDFLDAARLQGGHATLSRQKVDLAEIAQTAADHFRGAYESRKLRLALTDVPPIEGDPGRLAQVVDNLLSNAAKYSPEDQEIVLTVGMQEGQVVISVQDHGAGIAPEHIPLLFERFYRVSGPDESAVKGLGLGLSIVREIVAAHHGRVWAVSVGLDQGSTFFVSLPPAEPSRREQESAAKLAK